MEDRFGKAYKWKSEVGASQLAGELRRVGDISPTGLNNSTNKYPSLPGEYHFKLSKLMPALFHSILLPAPRATSSYLRLTDKEVKTVKRGTWFPAPRNLGEDRNTFCKSNLPNLSLPLAVTEVPTSL